MTDSLFGNTNGMLSPLSSRVNLPRDMLKNHPIMSLMRAVESGERGEMDMERVQWLNQLCDCLIKAGACCADSVSICCQAID
jgi:hypothetical protein